MSTQASKLPVMWARACRNGAGGTRPLALVVLLVVTAMRLAPAHAGQDFLNRDGPLTPAYLYPDSDGGEESDTPDEDPWDVFVEEKKHDDTRWELPEPFSLLQTTPARQTLVGGPTFRNQNFRTEVGGAVGYVNAMWPRLPFQVSIETGSWQRSPRSCCGARRSGAWPATATWIGRRYRKRSPTGPPSTRPHRGRTPERLAAARTMRPRPRRRARHRRAPTSPPPESGAAPSSTDHADHSDG